MHEHAAGGFVDLLTGRNQRRSGFANRQHNGDVIGSVSTESRRKFSVYSCPADALGGPGPTARHTGYISGGQVYVMGDNSHGQLGLGDRSPRCFPTPVPSLNTAVSMAFGSSFTIVALADGTAVGMGQNANGQLGDGTTTDRLRPTPVVGLSDNITGVAAGLRHSLFATSAGVAYGFGDNSAGQLGGTPSNRQPPRYSSYSCTSVNKSPVQVAGLSNVSKVYAGAFHSVATTSAGAAFSFGANGDGQLGYAISNNNNVLVPTMVSTLSNNVVRVACGQCHTLFEVGSALYSCGLNTTGQCGQGSFSSRAPLALVPSPSSNIAHPVLSLSAGSSHSVVVGADGNVFGFGSNRVGELDFMSSVDSTAVPTLMSPVSPATGATVGGMFTVVLSADRSYQTSFGSIEAPR